VNFLRVFKITGFKFIVLFGNLSKEKRKAPTEKILIFYFTEKNEFTNGDEKQ
jgi:hypothetical protein